MIHFVVHDEGDSVGVVVVEGIKTGEKLEGWIMDQDKTIHAVARNDEVRRKFKFVYDRYQKVIDTHKTSDLSASQPTKGNIEGGLTTIEEKALDNIQKIGKKCIVDGCWTRPRNRRIRDYGLWIPRVRRQKW